MTSDLREKLRPLLEKAPPRLTAGASIQQVLQYKQNLAKALAVMKKPRASDAELQAQINVMRGWFDR